MIYPYKLVFLVTGFTRTKIVISHVELFLIGEVIRPIVVISCRRNVQSKKCTRFETKKVKTVF